ncbi:LacI family DNA-binding transcriptional regulator [Acidimangrovimonas sediminis]|uniref:LacI family DNA-binding transcriptional regulator n=1 Tax=Acidimangrovimonas sediminis TaxID=2056283 RepID=UPI000C8000EC|nr:LacI family DNA-binding transcriptional regulator [Acidimangrovimonas sediminis]
MTKAPGKTARLKDVALRAGLAPATVSRFLNQSITLPDETAQRIRAAIAELNYRPNPIARSLSRGRSDTIGLALPDIANPFFSHLAAAAEVAARAGARTVVLSSTMNTLEGEIRTFDRLGQGLFDGLLFATNHIDEDGTLARLVNANAGRVVLVDEDIPDSRVPKVFSDNVQGGRLAGEALTDAGHRTIAYIGGPDRLMSTIERGAGLAQAIRAAGPDARVAAELTGDYTHEHGRRAMRRVLDTMPEVTGVFFGSDTIFMGALEVLRDAGLRLGREISAVTFDDAAPLGFLDPPVTAIRHSIDRIAAEAFALLEEAITTTGSDGAIAPRTLRIPVACIPRASVGPPPRAGSPPR